MALVFHEIPKKKKKKIRYFKVPSLYINTCHCFSICKNRKLFFRLPTSIKTSQKTFSSFHFLQKMDLREIGATLPPGFRFCPSDEELVCHYLFNKITNEEVIKGTLVEIDLHTCEPWQLPGMFISLLLLLFRFPK